MFEKVLILTDFSEHSKRLLDCIAGIRGIREIVLLHVIGEVGVPMGKETVESLVRTAAGNSFRLEKGYLESLAPDITVVPELVASSDIPGAVFRTAEKHGVSLIILSAYGMGMKTGLITGNVASAVLCRISRTDVLVMRYRVIETLTGTSYEKFCPMIFSRILCPTNFSPESTRALSRAGEIAGVGEIVLLHVAAPGGDGYDAREAFQDAESRIGAIRDGLAGKGVRARAIVKKGDPAAVITETAEDEDVSLIWISSIGKGCFHDFLLGSTVNDVVMHTKRPVIVIRSEE